MSVVRASELTEAQARLVAALFEATGNRAAASRVIDAHRQAIESVIAEDFRRGQSRWNARSSHLYKHHAMRKDLLRRGIGSGEDIYWPIWRYVPDHAKRRYQWAEQSWLDGYLGARQFFEEGRLFEKVALEAWAQRLIDLRPADLEREWRRARRDARKEPVTDMARWQMLAAATRKQRELLKLWQEARTANQERKRQLRLLVEGHRTLTSIRRLLRAPAQSPLRASRPARTSPTS